MKQLTQIFEEHKSMLLTALTEEVNSRGGVIKLKMVIGGKNSLGFDRQTIIDRVYLYHTLFDDEQMQLFVMAHDKKFPNQRIERALCDYSLDIIETICWACDESAKEGGQQ